MSKAYVEIDFFQMEKQKNASSQPSSPKRVPSTFRGIQGVVSRINPQLLKTVMAAEAAGQARSLDNIVAYRTSSSPPSPSRAITSPPQLPACKPEPGCFDISAVADTAPLTIFYNGNIFNFEVPRNKAETIMRMAETGCVENPAGKPEDALYEGKKLEGDLPMARRKSLQRFFEKRRQRLAWAFPYHKKFTSSRPC